MIGIQCPNQFLQCVFRSKQIDECYTQISSFNAQISSFNVYRRRRPPLRPPVSPSASSSLSPSHSQGNPMFPNFRSPLSILVVSLQHRYIPRRPPSLRYNMDILPPDERLHMLAMSERRLPSGYGSREFTVRKTDGVEETQAELEKLHLSVIKARS
ncbi:hypothetical protein L1887_15305 [Cichorium endivia]|nr:hypothetical protein L1887_15305 [Cichorium endivia]